ncbi:MAG: phage integrase SAM-like domain-containing protein [Bacteroidales bacterium]|nr:phage integrase SAM-like domain-containing protein [Bacteroidales bacterium]
MNSFLKLDTRRPLRDGTCPVRVGVGHGTDLYLPTGVYVRPSDWNARAQLCEGRGAAAANRCLSAILARTVTRCLDLRERGLWGSLTRAQLRAMLLDPSLTAPPADAVTLGEMFRRVMARKSGHTAEQYRITLARVARWCDPDRTPLSALTASWTEGFVQSLADLSPNSRAGYLVRLKSVVFAAEREGLCRADGVRSVTLRMEQTRPRDLSVEELRRLRDLPLSGEAAVARDLFMLTFYLIGINGADLLALTPDSVRNGRVEYRRAKTGRLYSIRVEPEAREIMDRYGGLPLAPLRRFGSAVDWSHWTGVRLKRLGVRDDLTPYFARYTWATLAARLDVPRDTISEALGHSYGSQVTGIYVQFGRDKIDAANRRVLDFVAEK